MTGRPWGFSLIVIWLLLALVIGPALVLTTHR